MRARILLLAGLAAALLAAPLRAELMIESMRWELAKPARGRRAAFEAVSALPTAPPRFEGKLLLRVVLKNRGPREADGILLRYCLAARLVRLDGGGEGIWAVPFRVDEKRVPKVAANKYFEVTLDPSGSMDLPFPNYLRRVYSSGFWPDQLKAQVMLSPHRGSVETIETHELILPVKRP